MEQFAHRRDAGQRLAAALVAAHAGRDDVVVLGLPRGGVPVAYEVARALGAPLDVFFVRKLGVPWHPELAMGAIASGGVRVFNDDVVDMLGVSPAEVAAVAEDESRELARREAEIRSGHPMEEITGKIAILVDDGLATGASMRAAVLAVRALRPQRVIVAVPVASSDTCRDLRADESVDEVVCVRTPEGFSAVGAAYEDFSQTTDEEVRALLDAARIRRSVSPPHPLPYRLDETDLRISIGGVDLDGTLEIPAYARGLVLFVHGSGSGRFSPRNRAVAAHVRASRFGTLLVDLLSQDEQRLDDATSQLRFDIDRLAVRVVGIVDALWADGTTRSLPLGLFGASTGAAAALVAAAQRPGVVRAVVSRGGRPDLAREVLASIRAPTLFIVGGADFGVLELNEFAYESLRCPKHFAVVPAASHLFEEPGALDHVAKLSSDWFARHLDSGSSPSTKKTRRDSLETSP